MVRSSLRYLVYDIESIVDKDLLQKVLYPELEGDPEAAYQTHVKALAEEGKDFINPSFHRPIAIAALGLSDGFEILRTNLLGKEKKTTASMVSHFWEIYNSSEPVLVDFNGKGFDLRLLELWAFRLGLTIGGPYFEKFGPRYRFSEDKHLDLHEFLTNHGAIRFRGGLNLFSKILGKPGKMHTTGDKVQELYDNNEIFRIDDYCLSDVMDTYFVFLRTLLMRGVIDLAREKALVEAAKEEMEHKRDEEGYFKEYLEHFSFWEAE